jgi:hypothetical protein
MVTVLLIPAIGRGLSTETNLRILLRAIQICPAIEAVPAPASTTTR